MAQIRPFEYALYEKLQTTYSSFMQKIRTEKKLTDEIEVQIKQIIDVTVKEISLA